MTKNLAFATCALTLALAAVGPLPLVAQEAVLEQFYGSGVHHYFSGDYGQAVADLDAAIDGGSQDPRAYYFRGLAKLRSGGDAAADFQQGAAMETADVNQYYPVGKSLERVQGSTRMTIERYRTLARATALSRQQRRETDRYDQLQRRETQVLRAPVAAPPTAASAVEPAPVIAQPAAPKPAMSGPAVAQPLAPKPAVSQPAVPQPPVPEPPAAEDPFADDAVKAPAAAEPTAPADAPKAEPPASPAADAPAEDMPAEEAPADEKAAPAKDEGDDPFGDPPAKAEEAEKKADAPATEEPAPAPAKAEEEDPFAEAEPK